MTWLRLFLTVLLGLLIFPALHTVVTNHTDHGNVLFIYFSTFALGPLLILYGILARTWLRERVFSWIVFMSAFLWISYEIVAVIKAESI